MCDLLGIPGNKKALSQEFIQPCETHSGTYTTDMGLQLPASLSRIGRGQAEHVQTAAEGSDQD